MTIHETGAILPSMTTLKPLTRIPSLFSPKPKRGADPTMGGMQSFYLNQVRERDPEYRQMVEELEGVAKRIKDYLDPTRESLIATALQMAVPSSLPRRSRVSHYDELGLVDLPRDINEKLPDGVSWRDAAIWTVRAREEQPAEIAKETGWPVAAVTEAITTFSQTIGSGKLLDEEGRLKQ